MPSIKCAHCKQTHESVAEVRNCAGIKADGLLHEAYPSNSFASRDKGEGAQFRGSGTNRFGSAYDRNVAKGVQKTPVQRMTIASAALPSVPHARYALARIVNGEPVWRFYVVDKPQSGKWAGMTFVNVLASDTETRLVFMHQLDVLEAIAKDPKAAAADYGHQIGQCSVCNRQLTNPESIALGIGPICLGKLG